MGTLSVGARGAGKGGMIPWLGTKIAPLALDYESAGKRLGTRQNTYTPTDLACLALVFENEGREKGNSTPALKGVWGKSTHSSGSRAQFLKTAVQQKGAVLRPGYSDTRPSWPEYGLQFYLKLSKSACACKITSLQDFFQPYIARGSFS